MPCQLEAWNVTIKLGNPTRSVDVNDLIKDIKKKEVCQQGKYSSADRPFKEGEFRQALGILHAFFNPKRKCILPALLLLAMQMIARLDDTVHLWKSTLMVCPGFDFALSARMRWSKNVSNERDAPRQFMLAIDGCKLRHPVGFWSCT